MVEIQGSVAPGYEPVRDAFAANFAHRGEVGAAFSAWSGERVVATLWGGLADPEAGHAWEGDTLVIVYSMTKALTTACVHHLVERGGLALDAPIARYWPEFGAAGKRAITVRCLLCHRAGLPVVEGDYTLDEALSWEPMVDALARQAPLWAPGSAHGYHLRTFGWLVGEVFRRAAGCSVGRYFAEQIARPLGLDWYLGLPEHLEPRAARVVPPPREFFDTMAALPQDLLLVRAATTPSNRFHYDAMWNERALRAVELPSSNSLATAAAVARFYAALLGHVEGPPPLRPETLRAATVERSRGRDRVLLFDTAFASGFQLQPWFPAAVGARSFGHAGAGGALGFADPDAGVAFAYTPNRLRFDARPDPRSEALADALYACLGRARA